MSLMAQGLDSEARLIGDALTVLPPVPILVLARFTSYQTLVNTVRALSEKPICYPLSIPFIN